MLTISPRTVMRAIVTKIEAWRAGDNPAEPVSERRERLEYLADLLNELQLLAEREGCQKLPTLLALSRVEALKEALSNKTSKPRD
jgi:hypothetical protein